MGFIGCSSFKDNMLLVIGIIMVKVYGLYTLMFKGLVLNSQEIGFIRDNGVRF
jgi:hypothetical protein